jgi:hypothetical protein
MTRRLLLLALVTVSVVACSDDPAGPSGIAPALLISLPDDSISVDQGWSVAVAVRVRPQSYSGPVSLSVRGLPQGVTGEFDRPVLPGVTADNEVTLTLTAGADVPAGRVDFTVTATGEGVRPGSATRGLSVERSATGNTTWTIRCDQPAWLGVMGPDGTWHRVRGRVGPAGAVRYVFDLPERGGAVTIMREQWNSDGWENWQSYAGETRYGTREELNALEPVCPAEGASNWGELELEVSGDSLMPGDVVRTTLGAEGKGPTGKLALFYAWLDRSQPQDLVVTHLKPGPPAPRVARIAVRRRLQLASTYRLELNLDRDGVAPAEALLTMRGIVPERGDSVSLGLWPAGARQAMQFWSRALPPGSDTPVTIFGVPSQALQPGDVQVLRVASAGDGRTTTRYFRSLVPQDVTLGPTLEAMVVEYSGGGPYPRLSLRGPSQPEYADGVTLSVSQDSHTWTVTASASVLGAGSWRAAIPDLRDRTGPMPAFGGL